MKNKAAAPGTVLTAQLRAKKDCRRRQAALPFARKIEIVICLQKLAAEIGAVMGRKPGGMVWRLTSGKYQKGLSCQTRNSKPSTRG